MDHINAVSDEDIITIAESLFQGDQLGMTTLGALKDENAFMEILGG
jgi:hypothetical protein